jgi:deazaflavin-dependent oxidoreductase (nitroreductase family)
MTRIAHADPDTPRGLRRLIMRLLASRAFAAIERSLPYRLVVWRLAPRVMRLTGGRLASLLPFPAAVLETRDQRNGRAHRRAVIYFHDGDRVTVIPSRAGGPRNPFWFDNAVAAPDVRLGGGAYLAHVVTDEAEIARLWDLAERFYPAYATYRRHAARSGRTIPILQLHAADR